MKKLLVIIAILILPSVAFGYSISGSPTGETTQTNFTLNVSVENLSELESITGSPDWSNAEYWTLYPYPFPLNTNNNNFTSRMDSQVYCYPISNLSGTFEYSFEIGDSVSGWAIYGAEFGESGLCESSFSWDFGGEILYPLNWDWDNPTSLFSVITLEGINLMIASANAGFASAMGGVTPSNVTEWTGDSLIKPFVGSGLGVLYYLAKWIVALVIIGMMLYFAFRIIRFFYTARTPSGGKYKVSDAFSSKYDT